MLGQGHGAGFGHSKGHRPGPAQHQHVLRRNAQGGVVNALGIVWPLKHDGWPAMLVQVRGRGWLFSGRLRRARASLLALRGTTLVLAARLRCGSRFATRRARPRFARVRRGVWPLTPIVSRSSIGSSALSRTGTPPALVEILHVPSACWLAIDQQRHLLGRGMEVVLAIGPRRPRRAMASRCTTAFVEPLSRGQHLECVGKGRWR